MKIYLILAIHFILFSSVYSQNLSVKIENKYTYFQVDIRFSQGQSRKQVGKLYGEAIQKAVPNYESLVDSYLKEKIPHQAAYFVLLMRAKSMQQNLNPLYREEIEGLSQAFSYDAENKLGDGKLSRDEFLLLSLLPDVGRATQCSALAVWGNRSETGSPLIARSLDWFSGSKRQLNQIQAVITYSTPGKNTVMSIGYLGFSGILTGINSKKVFAAILDSPTGEKNGFFYNIFYSYPLDLRQALEESQSIESVASLMSRQPYAFNHLIFLGDEKSAGILENALGKKRELRKDSSELEKGISWKEKNGVAAVNSFMLKGNPKNYHEISINPMRWSIFKRFMSEHSVISMKDFKNLYSQTRKGRPDSQGKGELYHYRTQQIIFFDPVSLQLEVFFSPVKGQPKKPLFEIIKLNL